MKKRDVLVLDIVALLFIVAIVYWYSESKKILSKPAYNLGLEYGESFKEIEKHPSWSLEEKKNKLYGDHGSNDNHFMMSDCRFRVTEETNGIPNFYKEIISANLDNTQIVNCINMYQGILDGYYGKGKAKLDYILRSVDRKRSTLTERIYNTNDSNDVDVSYAKVEMS